MIRIRRRVARKRSLSFDKHLESESAVGFFFLLQIYHSVVSFKKYLPKVFFFFSVPKKHKVLGWVFPLFPLYSLYNNLFFVMKLEVISKYTRISEEWLYRDYGSGLGATVHRFGPNFSP